MNLRFLKIGFSIILAGICLSSCSSINTQSDNTRTPNIDTVFIQQMKFSPDTLTIQKGDTVIFINRDIVDHDATALPDSLWQSPRLKMDKTWKFVPQKSSDYFCSIHVVMKGRINVNSNN